MKKIIVLLFLHNFMFSQVANTNQNPFIEVTGIAKKEIEPNLIYVSITLTEKSIDNKKYSIENQETKLLQILSDLNIPKSKLTLSDFNSSIITDKKREIGFKQTKEFNLILENGQQVSLLFDKLFNANIKEADIIKIDHTDIVTFNKEVRIDALKAAKAKAEYLLIAVGNKIGKPIEIIEINNENNYYRGNILSLNSYTPLNESEFKKIVISFSYKVKYSIE